MKNKKINWLIFGGTVLSVILIVILMTFIFRRVLTTSGKPPGVDTDSFTHTAQIVTEYFRKNHQIPAIDPYWYNDFELKYAPPLIYPPLVLLYSITNDADRTGSIGYYLISLFAALTMFAVIKKESSNLNAICGSLLFSLAPLIFMESRTYIITVAFLPLAFYFANLLLEKKKYSAFFLLSLIFAVTLSGHLMHGTVIIVGVLLYGLLYITISKDIPGNRFLLLLLAPVVSLFLAAFYLLPYFIEGGAWTSLSPESYLSTSERFSAIISKLNIALILISLYSVIRNRKPKRLALFIVCAIAAVFALGVYSPFPILVSVIRPNAPLLFASFGFAYLTATAFDFRLVYKARPLAFKIVGVLVLVAVCLYFSYTFNHFTKKANSKRFENDSQLIAKLDPEKGRIQPMQDIFQLIYIWEEIAKQANIYSNDGHYYALARPRTNISSIFDNINYGWPKQAINSLSHQNSTYVLVDSRFYNLKKHSEAFPQEYNQLQLAKLRNGMAFLAKLQENGYSLEYQDLAKGLSPTLYTKSTPSGYLQPIDANTLIIGKYANNVAAVLAEEGIGSIQSGSSVVDDYDLDFLKQFDNLALYGFGYRNKEKTEALLRDYVKGGGNLVIDMWGIEQSKLEDLPSILGVTGIQRQMTADFRLVSSSLEVSLPVEFSLPDEIISPAEDGLTGLEKKQVTPWRFETYMGLDESLLSANIENETADVVGIKRVDDRPVWFIGPNLFYHIYLSHNDKEIKLVKNIFKNTGPQEKKIEISRPNLASEKKTFNYTASADSSLLVSNTYSPHWEAYIDGKKTKVFNVENLMAINLPSGQHYVEMTYNKGNPPTHTWGKWLTIISLLLLVSIPVFKRIFGGKNGKK